MRIALFATCLGEALPQVPRATAHLVERLGHEVLLPTSQVCCGRIRVNTMHFP